LLKKFEKTSFGNLGKSIIKVVNLLAIS